VRLAVLGDAIGEVAKTPGLRPDDLPAIVFDDLGSVFRQRIDLGLSQILTREENMLIERHVLLLTVGRSLTYPSGTPLRLSSKKLGHKRSLHPIAGAYGETGRKRQGCEAANVHNVHGCEAFDCALPTFG
jgi:hypothetical protein